MCGKCGVHVKINAQNMPARIGEKIHNHPKYTGWNLQTESSVILWMSTVLAIACKTPLSMSIGV